MVILMVLLRKEEFMKYLLDEAGADNDAEQGATFKGTVNVEVKGAKTITGEATQ